MGKIHRNALKPGYQLHWYTIKEILGQGGFGITYLAHDNNLDENVAIKEYLPIELAVREGDDSVQPVTEDRNKNYKWGLDRFIKEARTLSKFKHPNIVRVRSVFEENNTAYMVMEYEQGETLQDILTRRKRLEEAELLSVLVPILGGLALVHKAGFIHRDIKPANIFIRKDGSPVLIDFGSARQALGEQTKTLTSLVSPGYAPFEQYYSKGESQGPWTDIYGLGATLYRVVVGRAPMDAVDRSRSIHEASSDTLVSAVDIGKGNYSARFLKAIDHALKFKPTERPQSLERWKTEFGIKNDLAEIKHLEIMEDQVTQPGTKVIARLPSRIRPLTTLLFIVLTVCVVAYYSQDTIKALFNSYMPGMIGLEVAKVTP
jgi:serine/threonine protein kinase